MFWYVHHGVGWGGWLLMSLSFVLFWGLVAWAASALFRHGRSAPPWPPSSAPSPHPYEEAERILAQRFAAGEISDEEYRHRLEVLRGSHTSG